MRLVGLDNLIIVVIIRFIIKMVIIRFIMIIPMILRLVELDKLRLATRKEEEAAIAAKGGIDPFYIGRQSHFFFLNNHFFWPRLHNPLKGE